MSSDKEWEDGVERCDEAFIYKDAVKGGEQPWEAEEGGNTREMAN